MGEDEAVDADHHRHRELLGQAEGDDMEVGRFLVGLGEELEPAGLAQRHGIRMIVPDVDGCTDGTVAERHDDGKPEARGIVDGLGHEQQALAGGGRVAAGTCRR